MLEQKQGLKLPKTMQRDFSAHVQKLADEPSRELNADDIWQAFRTAYHVQTPDKHFQLVDYEESRAADGTRIFSGKVAVDGHEQSVSGRGKGLISSVMATMRDVFGVELEVVDYSAAIAGRGHRCECGDLSGMRDTR